MERPISLNGSIDLESRRAALVRVLESKEFSRSPALARLLRYLCEKTFEGKVHEIKEFSIATEVYGRPQDFADKRDSIVRVEVSRLRKRLQHFYEEEGAGHPVRILIRAGTYQPEFECDASTPVIPPPEAPPVIAAPIPRRYPRLLVLAAVLAIGAFLLFVLKTSLHTKVTASSAPTVSVPVVLSAGDTPRPVRILAGSATERSVDRFGVEWLGDRFFVGGEQNRWDIGGKEMGVPVRVIRGAPDQLTFRTFRFGTFSYNIPLPKGKYELRLYFSEVIYIPSEFGDGVESRRVFDVKMNGQPLLSSFDIAADAGAAYTADIRVFENVSPVDGFLKLEFKPVISGAWLNAIELIPNETGKALPTRIITTNVNVTDHEGKLWGMDRYFSGGRQSSDAEVVTGTEDPELYKWQRYGNFTYRLPAPPGKYKLRLLFAETFFGPRNRGKGGAGSRIFNVYLPGMTLLKNFEIFPEAGETRALEKVFHGISPSAQGRIDITFEPVREYAVVQGIEVTPED